MKRNTPLSLAHMIITFWVLLLVSVEEASAQEAKFKALFIYKFVDYIQWPSQPKAITIGVLSSGDIYSELKLFTHGNSRVNVREIRSIADLQDIQILYAPDMKSAMAKDLVVAIANKSVLVISDSKSSIEKGADIGFFLMDEKLRFAIRRSSIDRKKMIPSSKLLALGEVI